MTKIGKGANANGKKKPPHTSSSEEGSLQSVPESRQEATVQVLKQSRSVLKVLETDTSFGIEEVVVSPGSKRRDRERHRESSVHVFFLCPKS